MDTKAISAQVDHNVASWGPTTLRYIAALLWLSNVSWKNPPRFGDTPNGCSGLCGFVQDAIEHPVLPGTAWFFDTIVEPNLSVFGWYTLIIEATLAALFLSGRYIRVAAVLGMIQSLGIGLAVANTPGEWYWAYILMMALSFTILVLAGSLRPTPTRVMAAITVGYGIVVGIGRARNGFTGDGEGSRVLFGGSGWIANFGQNVFPGSIALGLVLVAAGIAVWFVAGLGEEVRRYVGWAIVAFGAIMLLTSSEGMILALSSDTSTVCVIAALGLSLVPVPARALPTKQPGDAAGHA